MYNINNSQIVNTNNPVYYGKKNANASKVIEAPQELPRYSIDKILKEKDEFVKTVNVNTYYTAKRQEKSAFIKKALLIGAALGGYALYQMKKL